MIKKNLFLIIILIMIMFFNMLGYKTFAATTAPSGSADTSAEKSTVDDVMEGAQDFINKGQEGLNQINEGQLQSTSDFIYNLLLAIALVVAVVIGMVIGIQFMTASVEEKAKIKESLLPYAVGCVVVFGAFGIWKLAINVLSNW